MVDLPPAVQRQLQQLGVALHHGQGAGHQPAPRLHRAATAEALVIETTSTSPPALDELNTSSLAHGAG